MPFVTPPLCFSFFFFFFFFLIAARESCRSVCRTPPVGSNESLERVSGGVTQRSSFRHIQVWTETQSQHEGIAKSRNLCLMPPRKKRKMRRSWVRPGFFPSYRRIISSFSNYLTQFYETLLVSESFYAGSSCVLDIRRKTWADKNKHDHVFVRAGQPN